MLVSNTKLDSVSQEVYSKLHKFGAIRCKQGEKQSREMGVLCKKRVALGVHGRPSEMFVSLCCAKSWKRANELVNPITKELNVDRRSQDIHGIPDTVLHVQLIE